MKKLSRLASVVVTVVVLLAPAAPAYASPCDNLPDLSQYGWQWPC